MPTNKTSQIIEAIARYCIEYANDPSLFPPKKDTAVIDTSRGSIISEHDKCNTDDLCAIHKAQYEHMIGGRKIGHA